MMKVLIYDNKEKDVGGACLSALKKELDLQNVCYELLCDEELCQDKKADAVFAIGGDGTILFLAEFSKRTEIPIIGINAGKLGFLCEFEKNSVKEAVCSFVEGNLIKDKRLLLKMTLNDQVKYALNDVYVQRTYDYDKGNVVAQVCVQIDGVVVSNFSGDGAIISTPTGSTAYSFSLGGPLVSPRTSAFVVTPIAAHSFNQRPIVYPSGATCKIVNTGKSAISVFVDGAYIAQIANEDYIELSCAEKPVTFLRSVGYNFFEKLSDKLTKKFNGDLDE